MAERRAKSAGEVRLERLRGFRVARERDLSIAGAVDLQKREVTRRVRALGGVGLAWAATAPPGLAAASEPLRLVRGVLTVRVRDDAARFALDRWLRAGGQARLAAAAAVTVARVKLVV